MSKLKEYKESRKGRPLTFGGTGSYYNLADAAIAELEDELKDKTQAIKDMKRWHASDLKRIHELEHPEPVHKEFPFECPNCGLKATLTIDVTPC